MAMGLETTRMMPYTRSSEKFENMLNHLDSHTDRQTDGEPDLP